MTVIFSASATRPIWERFFGLDCDDPVAWDNSIA